MSVKDKEDKGPDGECPDCQIGNVRHGAMEMQKFLTEQSRTLQKELADLKASSQPSHGLRNTIGWMRQAAKQSEKNAETSLQGAYYEGYIDALTELEKEMELTEETPSVQPIEEWPDTYKPIPGANLQMDGFHPDSKFLDAPIEGDQSDWIEATTPPEKEGFYNAVTAENILIIDSYRYGRWDYDMIAGPSDCPDYVARYRPSTHEPLHAEGEAQPIADPPKGYISTGTELLGTRYAEGCGAELIFNEPPIADKEVPEEERDAIKAAALIEADKWRATGLEDWLEGFEVGGEWVYHKMQQELINANKRVRAAMAVRRTEGEANSIQIAGLLASNKEWGEKYIAMEKEMLDYRRELVELKLYLDQEGYVQRVRWLQELLDKYPSPTPTNKDNG